MIDYLVVFQPSGKRGQVQEGKTVMEAARELGVDLQSICGGHQACGKCKVRIEEGNLNGLSIDLGQNLSPPTEKELRCLGEDAVAEGYRLACATTIAGDLVIYVPPEGQVNKEAAAKTATQRVITLKPTVRNFYIELDSPTLGDPKGNWEKLSEELRQHFGLSELTIEHDALRSLSSVLHQGDWKVTATLFMNYKVMRVESGLVEDIFGLALDIGTTTLAGYLCNIDTGEVAATEATTNPQFSYGDDVISRITYASGSANRAEILHNCLIEAINGIVSALAGRAGISANDIVDVTVVGNTAMHHMFLNLDPQYLGHSPFTPTLQSPSNTAARDLGLNICLGANVYVLPIEAGFVGADNVGVLIAEEPYNQDDMTLIVDIGTNGELVLGNRQKLISASCATGPALEGAHIKFGTRAVKGAIEKIAIDPESLEVKFKVIGEERFSDESPNIKAHGICGSGIIDATAEMLRARIINHRGRLEKGISTPRLVRNEKEVEFVIAWASETNIDRDITVSQGDIRSVQLAKGALLSGARLLMRRLGVEQVDKVILAGSFGLHINKESALDIGLFPEVDPERVYSTGNAAGEGARLALLNTDKRCEAVEIARRIEYVELSLEPEFQGEFVQAMIFPPLQEAAGRKNI